MYDHNLLCGMAPQASKAAPPTPGMAKRSEALWPTVGGAINPPGHWDFFVSHTPRDGSIER